MRPALLKDQFSLILGAAVAETATLLLLSGTGRGGNSVRTWYKRYGVGAYAIDVLTMVLCVCLGKEVVVSLLKTKETDPSFLPLLCATSVGIQIGHDLLFGAWLRGYKGGSPIFQLFKEYASEVGTKIVLTDAAMILCTCLVSYLASKRIGYGPGLASFSLSAYVSLLVVYSF